MRVIAAGIPRKNVPQWLSLDVGVMKGNILRLPEPGDIDTAVETRLIVEFYSK